MIGAASFASSITRTTSTVLIICEITENSRIIVGLLIGVSVAYSTSNLFTKSFFDTVLTLKKLPYLPVLFSSDIYKLKAKQICQKSKSEVLYEDDSIYDMLLVLNLKSSIQPEDYIPVVKSKDNTKLIGAVRVKDCFEYLGKVGDKLRDNFNNESSRYSNSINYISSKLKGALQKSKVSFFYMLILARGGWNLKLHDDISRVQRIYL